MKELLWLTRRELIAIQQEIIAMSGGQAGVLNENALDSTLAKPQNLYLYSNGQATLYELAATYGYGLIKNHCFIDGNKRIALIAMYTFLASNGIELNVSETEAAAYMWELAASNATQDNELSNLAQWLKQNGDRRSTPNS
jgi:death-on-curing protein